jgi:hypothetical protein
MMDIHRSVCKVSDVVKNISGDPDESYKYSFNPVVKFFADHLRLTLGFA